MSSEWNCEKQSISCLIFLSLKSRTILKSFELYNYYYYYYYFNENLNKAIQSVKEMTVLALFPRLPRLQVIVCNGWLMGFSTTEIEKKSFKKNW